MRRSEMLGRNGSPAWFDAHEAAQLLGSYGFEVEYDKDGNLVIDGETALALARKLHRSAMRSY